MPKFTATLRRWFWPFPYFRATISAPDIPEARSKCCVLAREAGHRLKGSDISAVILKEEDHG